MTKKHPFDHDFLGDSPCRPCVAGMRLVQFAVGIAIVGLLLCNPAMADIVSGTVTGGSAFTVGGTFVKLTPPLMNPFGAPNSVGNDNFQSPDLYGFDEDQNIVLSSPLAVDVGASPIPAGTTVASHYIFFDPGPTEEVIGTVNFDSAVLGIITSTARLAASDILANTGVNYLSPGDRGLEPGDSATISGSQQILFDTTASSPGDYIRVLTAFSPGAAAAPEPGLLPMVGWNGDTRGVAPPKDEAQRCAHEY